MFIKIVPYLEQGGILIVVVIGLVTCNQEEKYRPRRQRDRPVGIGQGTKEHKAACTWTKRSYTHKRYTAS
jgi:hypothetical protein